jgi:hypothetical protein
MRRWHNRWLLLPALLAGALPAVWVPPGGSRRDSAQMPPDDWDIPRLVTHLREKGLDLRAVPAQKDGGYHPHAYLTTTDARWQDLNRLSRDPRRMEPWRGTLYCEWKSHRVAAADPAGLWDDGSFIAGPFLFFGDRRLLEQVRAAFPPP